MKKHVIRILLITVIIINISCSSLRRNPKENIIEKFTVDGIKIALVQVNDAFKESGLSEPCFEREIIDKIMIDSVIRLNFNKEFLCEKKMNNVVFVQFKIDSLGQTNEHNILKSNCNNLNRECLRLAKLFKFKKPICSNIKHNTIFLYKFDFTDI